VPFIVEVDHGHLARQGSSERELLQVFEGAGYRPGVSVPGPNWLFERGTPLSASSPTER
jgi:hypothetical protein